MPASPAGFVQDEEPVDGSGRAAKFPAITPRPEATVETVRSSRFMAMVRSTALSAASRASSCRRLAISHSTSTVPTARTARAPPSQAASSTPGMRPSPPSVCWLYGPSTTTAGATGAYPGRVAVHAMSAPAAAKIRAVTAASRRGRKSRIRRTESTVCRRMRRGPG